MTDNRELKRLYSEIVKGYTPVQKDGVSFYIKHFDWEDQAEIDEYYFNKIEQLETSGIPTESMMLERLEKKKVWTAKDETEIAAKAAYISNLEKSRDKQWMPSQIDYFQNLINEEKALLRKKKMERLSLIGRTRETFANEATNTFFVLKSFHSDKGLDSPLISSQDYDYMEDDKLIEFTVLYNKSMRLYSDNSIKKVSVSPFFQEMFFMAEDIYQFWGKPIKDLTIFQTRLSSDARYFKSIIQNSQHEIPEEIRNDPDKLLAFSRMDSGMKEQMSKGTGHNHSITGTPEDFKKLNIKTQNLYGEVARKLGKTTLTKEEMLLIDRGEEHLIKK